MLIRFPPIKYFSLIIILEATILYLCLRYILVSSSLLSISREKKTLHILVMGRKFSFPYVDI